MKVIHFSTNNEVGINLSVSENLNGDLFLVRCFQTANPKLTKPPETFLIRAEERHSVMEYLNKTHALVVEPEGESDG